MLSTNSNLFDQNYNGDQTTLLFGLQSVYRARMLQCILMITKSQFYFSSNIVYSVYSYVYSVYSYYDKSYH